jgi:hypothetical protein
MRADEDWYEDRLRHWERAHQEPIRPALVRQAIQRATMLKQHRSQSSYTSHAPPQLLL